MGAAVPDVSGLEPNVAIFVALASMVFAAYTLVKQARSSRLGELDTVVGRIAEENGRLLSKVEDLEAEAVAEREKVAALKLKLDAVATDLERCMAEREAEIAELASLKRMVEDGCD